MKEISVNIGGRAYRLACEEKEQQRLRSLATHLDEKVRSLKGTQNRSSYDQLVIMAALTALDEAWDLKEQLDRAQTEPQQSSANDELLAETHRAGTSPSQELTQKLNQAAGKLKSMAKEMGAETASELSKRQKPVKLNLKPKKMGL